MAKTGVKKGPGWDALKVKLGALGMTSADATLKTEVAKATRLNCLLGVRYMRDYIAKSTGLDPNAVLTRLVKRSSRALVDTGQMRQAVTFRIKEWKTGFAGIARNAGVGGATFNVAIIVHDGATIPVTAKMRTLFELLAQASEGKRDPAKLTGRAADLWKRTKRFKWRRLSKGTTQIVIPARPFVSYTVLDLNLQEAVRENYEIAVKNAIAKGI